MDLADYRKQYIDSQAETPFTLKIEIMAQQLITLLNHYKNSPNNECLRSATQFLVEVEKWKQMCIETQTGLAIKNDPRIVWQSLLSAHQAINDKEAFLAIMVLIGFGRATDLETGKRRAKQASAVLRFINPHLWGVVDWRNAAMLAFYKKSGYNADVAIAQARRHPAQEYRNLFDIINEDEACEYEAQYRALISSGLPRAADVDLALWAMSLAGLANSTTMSVIESYGGLREA